MNDKVLDTFIEKVEKVGTIRINGEDNVEISKNLIYNDSCLLIEKEEPKKISYEPKVA